MKATKADIIKLCVDELGGDAEQSIYIGDTDGDLRGASEIGMLFIGVTYGFGFKPGKKHDFKTVDSCSELLHLLTSIL